MRTIKFVAVALALNLLGSCKAKDADDPYNPKNYFNQPPLGKDTVRGVLTSVDLGSYYSSVIYAKVKDDDGGAMYDLQLWWHSMPPDGYSKIDTSALIGPDTRLSAFRSDNAILIENPLPVTLDVSMNPGRPKMTLDVKQLYLRINSATTIYYDADNKALREYYLTPDSAGRAAAKRDIDVALLERLGRYKNNGFPDRSPISPVFQRK